MKWNINSCDGIYNSFDVHLAIVSEKEIYDITDTSEMKVDGYWVR